MADPYFVRLGDDGSTQRFRAGPLTAGPWSPGLQHGGPPSALAVTLADRVVREAAGRADLVPLRLAADFLGPVPVGDIDVTVTVRRLARSAASAEVVVSAQQRECLLVRVWFVRVADTTAIASEQPAAPPLPPADVPRRPHTSAAGWEFGYGRSVRWWFTDGRPDRPGPAGVWALPLHPLLDGVDATGLARVALVADSASGVGAALDWSEWSFVNVDLDIHLSRPVAGEWVHLAADTTVGGHGSALARSRIADADGVVGSGLQTLVVAPIPTR